LEIGTGWIGWTEEQTLSTRILTILAAHKGRTGMLQAIFGSGEPEPPKDKVSAKVTDAKAMQKVFDAIG
jgi:hypothetical protein